MHAFLSTFPLTRCLHVLPRPIGGGWILCLTLLGLGLGVQPSHAVTDAENTLVQNAGEVLLQGRPIKDVLAGYDYAKGINWRVADIPGGRKLIEAACPLDLPRLLADQATQTMITPKEARRNLEQIDRAELIATFLADHQGNVSLHGLHVYVHCLSGKFKTVALPSSTPIALVSGHPLPRALPGYGERDYFPCEEY